MRRDMWTVNAMDPRFHNIRVSVIDEDTHEIIVPEAWLGDVLDNDDTACFFVAQSLRNCGTCFIGGGAAPLFQITLVGPFPHYAR